MRAAPLSMMNASILAVLAPMDADSSVGAPAASAHARLHRAYTEAVDEASSNAANRSVVY